MRIVHSLSAIATTLALAGTGIFYGDVLSGDEVLFVVEPTTVTVLGDLGFEAGEVVSVEDLVESAAELDQDLAAQMPLVEETLDEVLVDLLPLLTASSESKKAALTPVFRTSSPAFALKWTWRDGRNVRNAIRAGTSTWGWTHVQKHNVSVQMVQITTRFPQHRTISGSTTVYRTPANTYTCWLTVCQISQSMMVRVVHNNTMLSDGQPRGMITTYCESRTSNVCPNWVRDLAR